MHINGVIVSEWTAKHPCRRAHDITKALIYLLRCTLISYYIEAEHLICKQTHCVHNNRVNEFPASTPCSLHTMHIMCFKRIQLCMWSWSLTLICPTSLHLNHLADEGSLIISTVPCLYFRHTLLAREYFFQQKSLRVIVRPNFGFCMTSRNK